MHRSIAIILLTNRLSLEDLQGSETWILLQPLELRYWCTSQLEDRSSSCAQSLTEKEETVVCTISKDWWFGIMLSLSGLHSDYRDTLSKIWNQHKVFKARGEGFRELGDPKFLRIFSFPFLASPLDGSLLKQRTRTKRGAEGSSMRRHLSRRVQFASQIRKTGGKSKHTDKNRVSTISHDGPKACRTRCKI